MCDAEAESVQLRLHYSSITHHYIYEQRKLFWGKG